MENMNGFTKSTTMTNTNGIGRYDDSGSLTTGKNHGFTLLGDDHYIEKQAHFNRERIPERIVHAKGAGAHGYFEATKNMCEYTCACPFTSVGKKTPLFVRFSPVITELGSPDTTRDPRGFAIKMYTEEGNYDIVGMDKPVFFVRDALKFPDFIHSQQRHPVTNLKDKTTYWDFLSLTPESIHATLMNFTDRGTPRSYANLEGFGVHAFTWHTRDGKHVYVKYHFIPEEGVKTLTQEEATKIAGENPDALTQDLFDRIEKRHYPTYKAYVQIMKPEQIRLLKFDPFDATKVWPHGDFPLIEIGKIVLNRNPTNFFSEVEQVGFAPSTLIPGITFSPDKLLQGRLFAYADAQRYRLGVNHTQLSINAPRCPVHTYHKDGFMRFKDNGDTPTYFPNSVQGAPRPNSNIPHIEFDAEIVKISRETLDLSDDDYVQARSLWNKVLDDTQKDHLVNNIVGDISHAAKEVQYRELAQFYLVDKTFGERVAKALKLDVERVKHLSSLSLDERIKETSPLSPSSMYPHDGQTV